MTKREARWLASIFNERGTITWRKHHKQSEGPLLQIRSADQVEIEKIAALFKTRSCRTEGRQQTPPVQWETRAASGRAAAALREILPYLEPTRAHRAKELLERWTLRKATSAVRRSSLRSSKQAGAPGRPSSSATTT